MTTVPKTTLAPVQLVKAIPECTAKSLVGEKMYPTQNRKIFNISIFVLFENAQHTDAILREK